MKREIIETSRAPKAIGTYSQAVRVGDTVYISGQIPLEPATGELVKGTIEQETQRVMDNLRAVLAEAGGGFEHVVRCGIYLVDLADFAKVNEIYGRRFPQHPPARATVQVAALPRGARVEIDAVAVLR